MNTEGMSDLKRKMVEDKEAELKQINLEMHQAYQANIRKSEELLHRILLGVRAEEDLYSLFMKACEAIGLMCGDSIFLSQVQEFCRGNYLSQRPAGDEEP